MTSLRPSSKDIGGLVDPPAERLQTAQGKLAMAQLALQGIDTHIVGARGAVEYVLAITEAAREDLRQALAYDPEAQQTA